MNSPAAFFDALDAEPKIPAAATHRSRTMRKWPQGLTTTKESVAFSALSIKHTLIIMKVH